MIPRFMLAIRRELERFALSLPPPVRSDFVHYLHARREQRNVLRTGSRNPAYWLLLPWWISKTRTRPSNPGVLRSILWGQYCLYLAIRIKDDLFDKQVKYRNLHLAGTAFLEESERAFLGLFPPASPFWRYYHYCIATTQAAIFRVDKVQKTFRGNPTILLREYARVSAIFKVGSLASCILIHQRHWMPRISRFADSMAIASQILDDFQDISEDTAAGRLNYAALFCLNINGRVRGRKASQHLGSIAGQMFFSDATDKIFAVVRRHMRNAEKALRGRFTASVRPYISRYDAQVAGFQKELHKKRMEMSLTL